MMAKVELLYFAGCPNVAAAREQLKRAFAALALTEQFTEIDVLANGVPEHLRRYGSPTIRVDGQDVVGAAPVGGSACRVYAGSDRRGAPPLDVLVAALGRSGR